MISHAIMSLSSGLKLRRRLLDRPGASQRARVVAYRDARGRRSGRCRSIFTAKYGTTLDQRGDLQLGDHAAREWRRRARTSRSAGRADRGDRSLRSWWRSAGARLEQIERLRAASAGPAGRPAGGPCGCCPTISPRPFCPEVRAARPDPRRRLTSAEPGSAITAPRRRAARSRRRLSSSAPTQRQIDRERRLARPGTPRTRAASVYRRPRGVQRPSNPCRRGEERQHLPDQQIPTSTSSMSVGAAATWAPSRLTRKRP